MEDTIRYEYVNGIKFIHPTHSMVKNWRFADDQEEEARLCYAMAVLAEKNGLTGNDMMSLFPPVLRIMKSDGQWAQ